MSLSQDEHDMLIRVDENVKSLLIKDVDKEERIRSLEKWKWFHLAHLPGIGILFKLFLK